ncbi:MAG: protein-glutamate O-methyltransferase family protein [Cytophagales bacterium]|nr:protein-glutamate O-methyltransferase family protein [Cytophagales bacterium]
MFDQYAPITGMDENSFAAFTIRNRLPVILERIINENDFSERINRSLLELKHQIVNAPVTCSLKEGTDLRNWEKWLLPYAGKTWFELPFYVAEAYFYRLVLDKVGYFSKGTDPFAKRKREEVDKNAACFAAILADFQTFLSTCPDPGARIKYLLFTALWGNKSDLSQLRLNKSDEGMKAYRESTIIDDTEDVAKLFNRQLKRIDIILDNAGVELFTDLLLADEMISSGRCKQVVLHSKAFPTFVSDAIESDVAYLIYNMENSENQSIKHIFQSIGSSMHSGSITNRSHPFWNAPLHFYEMPDDLKRELNESDLLIFKGDANYRRVFGDRQVPIDLAPGRLSEYLPSRSLSIRILKSEILVGMPAEKARQISNRDREWLVNGNYGMIQMLKSSISCSPIKKIKNGRRFKDG